MINPEDTDNRRRKSLYFQIKTIKDQRCLNLRRL